MDQYWVFISKRPLGIQFAHGADSKSLIVLAIKKHSIGEKLGISVGDVLIAINQQSVSNMRSEASLHLIRQQPLPFRATFERHNNEKHKDDPSPFKNVIEVEIPKIHQLSAVLKKLSIQTEPVPLEIIHDDLEIDSPEQDDEIVSKDHFVQSPSMETNISNNKFYHHYLNDSVDSPSSIPSFTTMSVSNDSASYSN